jgi:hypothetical protein
LEGQRRIASLRAASFAPSLPGAMPTARFHVGGVRNRTGTPAAASHALDDASASAEGEGADSALPWPRAHELDEGLRCVRLVDELGQKRRVDAASFGWPIVEAGHVKGREELTCLLEDGDRAVGPDIDSDHGHELPSSARQPCVGFPDCGFPGGY